MLRKAPDLPITFGHRGSLGNDGGGRDRIRGSVPSVPGHVSRSGSVTGCAGGRSGCGVIGIPGGGMGGQGGGARRAAPYLTTRPGTRCFDRLARSVVLRVLLLEEREHMLGAVGGPERQ